MTGGSRSFSLRTLLGNAWRTFGRGVRWTRDRRSGASQPTAVVVLAMAALALVAGSALAAKVVVDSFGSDGSGDGQFGSNGPRGVAVYEGTTTAPGTDEVYVGDRGNFFVQVFDSAGTFQSKFGGNGTAEGQFNRPWGVAVDQSDGSLYVTDQRNMRVQKFDSDGTFERMWGWGVDDGTAAFQVCTSGCQAGLEGSGDGQFARDFDGHPAVDPTNGNVYVPDKVNRTVQLFDSSGNFLFKFGGAGTGPGQFGEESPTHVAVDSGGNLYMVDRGNGRVQRLGPAGATPTFGDAHLSGEDPHAIAIDPSNDNVLVATRPSGAGEVQVVELTQAGELVDVHGVGDGIAPDGSGGIALNSASGALYVTQPASTRQVFILDDPPATVTVTPATNVTGTSATLNGTVNPNGTEVTDCHFEYVDDAEFQASGFTNAQDAACDPDPGGGTAAESVSADVSGLTSGTTYHVRLLATNGGGTATSGEATFTTLGAPVATIAPVTDITATSATFNGSVDPNGASTDYHFEYSGDGGATWTPTPTRNAGTGGDDVPVSEEVAGLQPSTEYVVRLVASSEVGDDTSGEETFETATPLAPTATVTDIEDITSDSATLHGIVNPNFSPTSYHFEYSGDGGATWTSVPVPDEDVGAGSEDVPVSQPISGLQPDTEYRVRLVATNEINTTTSDEVAFRTFPLPACCRAFEVVSPLDKNGGQISPIDTGEEEGDVSPGFDTTAVPSADGNGIVYFGLASFADNPGAPLPSTYLARREPPTWRTQGISPPSEPLGSELNVSTTLRISDDQTRTVVSTTGELTDDPLPPEMDDAYKMYLHDLSSGTYKLITHPPLPGSASSYDPGPTEGLPADVDADLSHVLFETEAALTEEALAVPGRKLYQWVDDGTPDGDVTLASVLPGGTPTTGTAGDGSESLDNVNENSISDDGSIVYFTSPPGQFGFAGALYRREGGVTTLVHPNTVFGGATPDGRYVFHGGGEGTDEGGRYDAASGTTTLIPGTYNGVLGFSDDGSRAYLEGGRPTFGGTITLWDSGVITEVGDNSDRTSGYDPVDNGRAQATRWVRTVSRNGEALLLVSDSPNLVPGANRGGVAQVYLYRASSDSLVCVSCPAGDVPTFHGRQWDEVSLQGEAFNQSPRGNLSDDGSRAFFQTATQLVPEDTNGVTDVYAFESGRPSLVSSGRSEKRSLFAAASASGDDVFFTTTEQLSGWDTDAQRDMYDARIGGGLPQPNPPVECAGDECQGAASGRPLLLDPVSELFTGPGDEELGRRPRFRVLRPTRRQSARLARGRSAALRVRVNQAGRVTVRVRAKIGKRRRQVARGSKRARKAGTVRIIVRLSKPARRRLARGRRLPLSVLVRFAGVREARRMTLRLRRPNRGARRSGRRAGVRATRDRDGR